MPHEQTETVTGFLGPDLLVRGRIDGHGDLEVAGAVEGPVSLNGQLSVAPTGRIRGAVRAQRADVGGVVTGDVTGGEVQIRAGGRVVGDVRAARIGLDDGGVLDGAVEMDVHLPESLAEEMSAT